MKNFIVNNNKHYASITPYIEDVTEELANDPSNMNWNEGPMSQYGENDKRYERNNLALAEIQNKRAVDVIQELFNTKDKLVEIENDGKYNGSLHAPAPLNWQDKMKIFVSYAQIVLFPTVLLLLLMSENSVGILKKFFAIFVFIVYLMSIVLARTSQAFFSLSNQFIPKTITTKLSPEMERVMSFAVKSLLRT